jgi:hypothetical protein
MKKLIASIDIRLRILLTLASLGTLLYTIGAPYDHGG